MNKKCYLVWISAIECWYFQTYDSHWSAVTLRVGVGEMSSWCSHSAGNKSEYQTFQPSSHANLEVLKNKARNTWRLGPQTWRLQKYVSNENNNNSYLFQSSLYFISAVCCTLLLLSSHLVSHLGSFSSHWCLSVPAILWWWGGSRSHLRLETELSIAAISLTNLMRLLWAQISRYSFMPSGIVWQFKAYW